MTKISQYTEASPPGLEDLLIGTDINGTGESTKNFLIGDINTLFKVLTSLQDVVNVGNTIVVPTTVAKGIDITLANQSTVYQNGVLVTIPLQTTVGPGIEGAPDAFKAVLNGQSPDSNGSPFGFVTNMTGADNVGFVAEMETGSLSSKGFLARSKDNATGHLFSGDKIIGGITSNIFNITHDGNIAGKSFIKTGGTSAQFLMANGSTSTMPTLQQVTEAGSTSNVGIQISTVDENSISGSSETGVGIYGYSDEGIGVYGYSETGRAISVYSELGIGLEIYGNGSGTPSIDMNLGNSNKGLVIDSGTSSTGNPIEINKNGVNKFNVNQAGDVVANSLTTNFISANSSALVIDADGATLTLDGGGSQIIANQPFIAESIAKSGGTSAQFLKADGSTDSSVFQKTIARTSANSSGAGSTSQILVGSALMPANSFVAGDWINLKTYINKSGANGAITISVYINTIESLSGATSIGAYTSANSFIGGQFSREWILNGSELRGFYLSSFSSLTGREPVTSTSFPTSAAFNVATAYYMLVAVQMGSVSDEYTYRGVNITN